MKALCVPLLLVAVAGCQSGGSNVKLESQKDKLSYAIGLDIGTNLHRDSIGVDIDILMAGIRHAMSGDTSKRLMTDAEIHDCMMAFQQERQVQQETQMAQAAEKNKKEGEEFLAGNAKREGVKTTASGLQYEVLQEGNGPVPKADQTVTTNYRGTLIDGTEFDSSYKRGQPATFPVNGVIAGWTEALQMMKVGSKWKLYIPSGLAYGQRGAGGVIGPDATLIFELELLSVK